MRRALSAVICVCFMLTGCANQESGYKTPYEVNQERENSESEAQKGFEIEHYGIEEGETKYFVTINIAQSHFTLDLMEHLKDSMNDVSIEIMVDKDYYDSVEIGENIEDSFRWGSFIKSGSIGSWDIKVTDKRTETYESEEQ